MEKVRAKGRVVSIATRAFFWTVASVMAALANSRASRTINTSFVERQNGTDRHRNARKVGKSYRFSKDWRFHEAVTYLTLYTYNFCWPVRTLATLDEQGHKQARSPAMASGLADQVWTMAEWLSMPTVQHTKATRVIKHAEHEFSSYAHLNHESIMVNVGDVVKAGQVIARCGNSGVSREPHLHFELDNTENASFATGFPPFFRDVKVKRDGKTERVKDCEPKKEDYVIQK